MKKTFFGSALLIVASVGLVAGSAMALPHLESGYELNASEYWTVTSETLADNYIEHVIIAYNDSHQIRELLDEPRDGGDLDFENVVVSDNDMTAVPEPATMLLFGAGLAGLAGFRLRKKRKA